MDKSVINRDKIRKYFIKRLKSANLNNFDLIFKKEIKKFDLHLNFKPALLAEFYDSKELFLILNTPTEKEELVKQIVNIAWGSKGQINEQVIQTQKRNPSMLTNLISWFKFGR